MIKRVFFAINPDQEKREKIWNILEEKKSLFPHGSVKWVEKENIHLTLIFVGGIKEEKIEKLIFAAKKTSKMIDPFEVPFFKVCYHYNKGVPQLIWLKGETTEELSLLKKELEKNLEEEGVVFAKKDDILAHITIGRVRKWEIKKMEKEEIPEVEEDISLSLPASSISLFESVLKKEGPQYNLLESIDL